MYVGRLRSGHSQTQFVVACRVLLFTFVVFHFMFALCLPCVNVFIKAMFIASRVVHMDACVALSIASDSQGLPTHDWD